MQYFIGLDVHRKFSQVCVLDQMGHTVRESKLYHEDVRQMTEFFAASATGTPLAMEATIGWMWITDMLQERGFDVWVLRDPWGNEFCVLHPNFPELLDRRRPWTT